MFMKQVTCQKIILHNFGLLSVFFLLNLFQQSIEVICTYFVTGQASFSQICNRKEEGRFLFNAASV